ncbi:MAG TPA: OmpA family protein [Candidatus Caccoplasma merdavium]|nr:OmpA family protein [Candidatus Caccoplasma merdavium]
MKTKKHVWGVGAMVAALLFWTGTSATAQTLVVEEEIVEVQPLPGTQYYSAKGPRSNWFMSVGAGTQTYVKSLHRGKQQFTLALDVAAGKWITPYLALRLDFMGGSVKKMWPRVGEPQGARYVALYGDLMWDLTNALGGYDPMRIVSFRPFAGVGAMYTFKNDMAGRDTYLFPVSAGININFRLCHYADFFIEGRANMMGNNFSEQFWASRRIETIVSAVAGITVKFGKERFNSYNPYAEQALVSAMNQRINDLREELEDCESRPLPPPEKVVVYKTAPAPVDTTPKCQGKLMSVVRFSINSAEIAPVEMVNIYNVAQYMKANKSCTLVVTGYADEKTGTPAYNKQLSQKRAQAVMDTLIKQYNIPAGRIEMVAGGSTSQPYPQDNSWNRIVLFSTK